MINIAHIATTIAIFFFGSICYTDNGELLMQKITTIPKESIYNEYESCTPRAGF